jgi:hypothetical protein
MTAPVRVHVTHTFTSSTEEVFEALSEHENLGPLFGANITRLKDGDTERNGVGSARTLRLLPLLPGFVETTTVAERPSLIEYRITGGVVPITQHHGIQRLTPTETGGTFLDYTIAFNSPIPGVAALVGAVLTRTLTRALARLVP